MSSLYQQPVLTLSNPETFHAVKAQIDSSFSPGRVVGFLRSVKRSKLRIRDFEAVLGKGLLGSATLAEYGKLDNSDQGQIRELYLACLERIAPELREKYYKLYAYY